MEKTLAGWQGGYLKAGHTRKPSLGDDAALWHRTHLSTDSADAGRVTEHGLKFKGLRDMQL